MPTAPRTRLFCFPSLRDGGFAAAGTFVNPPAWLAQSNAAFFFRGSTALWQGLKLLKARPGQTILFPSYHCGIELDVVCKAGFRVEFYRVGRDLRIDPDALRRMARVDIRALYVIHYFGFPQPMSALRQVCADCGWELIEDCAHALFAESQGQAVGTFGDIAIFSLHKYLPVPCGGVLVVNQGPHARPSASRHAPLGWTTSLTLDLVGRDLSRSAFMNLGPNRWLMPRISRRIRDVLTRQNRPSLQCERADGDVFDETWADARMPGITRWLLRRIPYDPIVERRRSHFAFLLNAMAGCDRISPLLNGLPDGACPGFFPVTVSNGPARFLEFCSERGVRARPFWTQFHKAFPAHKFPESEWLKKQVVILPVHQGLTEENLAELNDLIQSWEQQTD